MQTLMFHIFSLYHRWNHPSGLGHFHKAGTSTYVEILVMRMQWKLKWNSFTWEQWWMTKRCDHKKMQCHLNKWKLKTPIMHQNHAMSLIHTCYLFAMALGHLQNSLWLLYSSYTRPSREEKNGCIKLIQTNVIHLQNL